MENRQINSDTDERKSKGHVRRWQELSDMPQMDHMAVLLQDEEALVICLRPVEFQGHYLRISFPDVLCLRNTPERFFLNGVDSIEKALWGATFFTVEDSAFVRQFHENSSWAFDDWNVRHYGIFTSNFCIEILSVSAPTICWTQDL
jgi:hypothetical protein